MAKIDVIVFEPGKDGVSRTIDDGLESMQEIVGGYIEMVPLMNPGTGQPFAGLVVVCNEDGGLKKLPPSRWGFVGTFFVTRLKGGSKHESLTEHDRKIVDRLVLDDITLV